jgi:hypothetical protein
LLTSKHKEGKNALTVHKKETTVVVKVGKKKKLVKICRKEMLNKILQTKTKQNTKKVLKRELCAHS